MNALSAVGYLAEFIGLVIAFMGIRKTLGEFAPGEGVLDPVRTWASERRRAVLTCVREVWRRIRQQKPNARYIRAAAIDVGGAVGSVSVRKGYGPPVVTTVEDLATLVQARTQELLTRTDELSDEVAEEARVRDMMDAQIREYLDGEIGRLDLKTKDVATGSLRLQFTGLFVVGVGLGLQALGQYVGT